MKEYQRIGPDYNKTILVVGADVLETEVLNSVQQATPYYVHRVFTGAQALQYAREHPVDILLLSFSLPDTDGLTLYDEFNKTIRQSQIPTILLNATSSGIKLEHRNIINLTQPLDRDHLLQTLDTLFLFPRCPVEAI